MVGGSNDSKIADDRSSRRGSTLSPVNSPKLARYIANDFAEPAARSFKEVQLKQGHQNYQRNILGGLLGFAFLALLGGVISAYFGYALLSVGFVCLAGGFSAVNYWLNQSIPEFKGEPCAKEGPEKCTKDKEKCLDASPKVIFRGVAYPINHQVTAPLPERTADTATIKAGNRR